MSGNNKIYVTTSSQTISTNVKVDNSGYFTEKAKQYAEQSEASAQKSQANVDRLLANDDFINVSQNLDLIVEAGQKIEGIDLEAILNAEASAKQSSESALASANLSEENAQTTTTNAQLSKTYRDECEEFSETSKGYMDNTNYYYNEVNSLASGCRSEYEKARTEANNARNHSINASISETNVKASENKVVAKSNEIQELVKNVPDNFTTLPIGTIIPVSASSVYSPTGTLPCDGAEYQKADFENLWDKYLIAGLLNTCTYEEYDQDITTNEQCSKFAIKPLALNFENLSIVGSPLILDDGIVQGFSASDYVSSSILNSAINKIEIFTPAIITGSDVSTQQYIVFQNVISDGLAIRLLIASNQFISTVTNSTNQNVARGTYRINANTKYFVKYEISKETVAIYISTDNINWTLFTDGSAVNTTNLVKIQQISSIGIYNTSNPLQFLGELDFKCFEVVTDNTTIFKGVEGNTFKVPTITNENTDLTNFIVVANGMQDDCLATWNTLLELENYLKGV
jgi:hypothetical protein